MFEGFDPNDPSQPDLTRLRRGRGDGIGGMRRPKSRRGYFKTATLIVTAFSALCLVMGLLTMHNKTLADAYDKAPACSAAAAQAQQGTSSACRVVTKAVIRSNPHFTGNGKHQSDQTQVSFTVDYGTAGGGTNTTGAEVRSYSTQIHGDQRARLEQSGDELSVVVWKSSITEVMTPTGTLNTQDNPDEQLGGSTAAVVFSLLVVLFIARFNAWTATRRRSGAAGGSGVGQLRGRSLRWTDAPLAALAVAVVVLFLVHQPTLGEIALVPELALVGITSAGWVREGWRRAPVGGVEGAELM